MVSDILKYFLLRCAKGLAQLVYFLFRIFPVQRKVVLLSRQQDSPSTDFRLVTKKINELYPDYKTVAICRKLTRTASGIVSYVPCFLSQLFHLATSEACAVDGYVPAIGMLSHRKSLVIVQMWHALGALKKFGHQTIGNPMGHSKEIAHIMGMHRNYTHILCSGEKMLPIFSEAFDYPDEKFKLILEPHVDVQQTDRDAALKRIFTHYPKLEHDTNRKILYAPTFRKGKLPDTSRLFSLLLKENYTLIFANHPSESASKFDAGEKAQNFIENTVCSSFDLLHLVDYIITDYSAIALEAALLERPVLFYVPDIKEYRKMPGLNIDPLLQFPEAAFSEADDLLEALIALPTGANRASTTFANDYLSGRREQCTEAVVDLLLPKTNTAAE